MLPTFEPLANAVVDACEVEMLGRLQSRPHLPASKVPKGVQLRLWLWMGVVDVPHLIQSIASRNRTEWRRRSSYE